MVPEVQVATEFDFQMLRGDVRTFDVVAKQAGVVINLTTYTSIRLHAKYHPSDADDSAAFTCRITDGVTVTNAAAGAFTVVIAPAKTASLPPYRTTLYYDLQIAASGNPLTLAYGKITVIPDCTVSTAV